jgi:threonine aldolase
MGMIDLRSDTITKPTPAMLEAIVAADVGDDVFCDDPTINRLQDRMAELTGKEAAIYVPSGTMANQIALRLQTRPGDQLICESDSHIYHYEQGGPAALSGLLVSCVSGVRGNLTWGDIRPVLNPDDDHSAPPSLICLENTHNRAGGTILDQSSVREISIAAHDLGLKVHMDGARLWNAHVAGGLSLAELADPVDSVSLCFSKGMGAPVGSVLAGGRDFVRQARRVRKLFGGGMRQAGILAAACLYALDHNLPLLAQDHEHARLLADGLDNPAIGLAHEVQTNIVIFQVADQARLLEHLQSRQILGVGFGEGRVRLVTNLMISRAEIDQVIDALNSYDEEPS